MGIRNWFNFSRPGPSDSSGPAKPQVSALNEYVELGDLNDPYLAQFMRAGAMTQSGAAVTPETALRNTAVFRSVSLVAYSIAMLPLHLYRQDESREKATQHPLFRVLHRKPNGWQTAFEFRQLMQAWALIEGDAFAKKIMQGQKVVGLIPMDPKRTKVVQKDDLTVWYKFTDKAGNARDFPANEIFHLRGFTLNGITGRSLVHQAAEAIGLAARAEQAAARLFRNGMIVGGALQMPEGKKLSAEAFDRLRSSMDSREGAENAHKWMILEEGLEAKQFSQTAENSQHLEMRSHQVEEIARVFGVPRPLLMVDDTSWGSGIDVLGQMFVRYGLNPWFEAWEQAIARCLLSERDQELFQAKFNAGALLRGSMKDQADFFAKALSVNNQQPWLHQSEVREMLDLPARNDLPAPIAGNEKEPKP